MRKFAGKSGQYAEIVIDYSKKKVEIINPENNKHFKRNRWMPTMSTFWLGVSFLGIFITSLIVCSFYISTNLFIYSIVGCFVLSYVLLHGFNLHDRYHLFEQCLWNAEFFGRRKYIKIERINKKIWALPYMFENRVLNYRVTGDKATQLFKVHIKPKEWCWKIRNHIEVQVDEWDAIFYFKQIPKNDGYLEIEWL